MVGDAAGIIDLTRGVGTDTGAFSGRLAAKAIGLSQKDGETVIDVCSHLMKDLVDQTKKNQQKGILTFETNEGLQAYLDEGMLQMGMKMYIQRLFNKFRSGEHQRMLP